MIMIYSPIRFFLKIFTFSALLFISNLSANINEKLNEELITELVEEHGFDEQYVASIFNQINYLPQLIENISKKGWFFTSPAGNKIDGKFLFGQDKIATSNEVKIEISPWDGQSEIIIYTVENIPKQEEKEYEFFEEKESDNNNQYILLGIIIAVGIGTALFYLKGYKPKH